MAHEIRTYSTPSEFWDDVGPFLLEDEPFHSLAIGLTARFIQSGLRTEVKGSPSGPLWASGWHPDGSFDFAAWCTPPKALTLTGGGSGGLRALVDVIRKRGGALTRCNGPVQSIEHLVDLVGSPFQVEIETALHRLDSLCLPARQAEIHVSAATSRDQELVGSWCHRFAIDAGFAPEGSEPPKEPVDLQGGQYFLARDSGGEFVSMTAITRETPNSANLSYVYTPEEQRGRGYASALVADVSRRVLGSGKSYCTLYTDLANPTSNKIYRALGYRPIGEFREVSFGG